MTRRNDEALSVVLSVAEDCFYRCLGRFWFRCQRVVTLGNFEEAVEDDEEFLDIGRNNSANYIFLTLATDFLTEAPAREHLFRN